MQKLTAMIVKRKEIINRDEISRPDYLTIENITEVSTV